MNALTRADEGLYRALRIAPKSLPAVRRFSRAGEHAACWIALGLAGAALDRPRRRDWVAATKIVASAYVANVALKNVTRRKRPLIDGFPALVRTPTQLSFPSAHACSSFAAARVYGALLPPASLPLHIAATAMALSRVSLGVHYPSDVVAGAALGTAIGEALR